MGSWVLWHSGSLALLGSGTLWAHGLLGTRAHRHSGFLALLAPWAALGPLGLGLSHGLLGIRADGLGTAVNIPV
jgi:hypothetical protein